jgi:nitrogen fixation NifU-like protein
MYSSRVLDHFEHPRNTGELADANARARVENPVCGDVLELSVKTADGFLREVRFRAQGCVPTLACGSLITELVRGRTIAEAAALAKESLIRELGGLPAESGHAAQLAIDALRAVLEKIK